jgi:cytochrome c556
MKSTRLLLGCGAIFAIAAAGNTAPAAANLHELMKDVAVQTQIIWDIGNRAMDEEGNPDPSKLAEADWAQIASAGTKVKDAAKTMAEARQIVGAAPGQKIQGEGNPGSFSARDVEKAIADNPRAFSAFAQQLAGSMDEITRAARLRNAAKVFDVAGQLDQVCEQCHMRFWYPEQKVAL